MKLQRQSGQFYVSLFRKHYIRMKLFFSVTRSVIIGLSLSLLSSCAELEKNLTGKSPQLSPRVYVANESSNSVTVIDALTFRVLPSVRTLRPASAGALKPAP